MLAIGQAIRARREELGLTQDGFANEVGFDRSYYGHIERGNYNLTLTALLRIAVALDVPAGDLLVDAQELCRAERQ